MYKENIVKTQFKLFLRFFTIILPYRKRWFLILILSNLGMLLGLVNPYLAKIIIDKGIGSRDLRIFIILALVGGGIFILIGLIDCLKQFLIKYIKVKVNFDLNKKVFRHLQKLSFNYFTDKSTGEHLYKISYDIDRVTDFITITPPQVIALFPRLLLILGFVFYLNWRMAIFSLILTPFLYFPSYYFSRNMRRVWKSLVENYQAIFKTLFEMFSHIQLIKVFGREAQSVRHYLKMLITNIRLTVKNIKLEIFSVFVSQSLNKAIIGLVVFYGGYQVIKGHMTLGSLTAIMGYLTQLVGLQIQFTDFFQTTAFGLVSCERIACILDEKPKVSEPKEAKQVRFQRGGIIFREVSFGYNFSKPILEKISFNVEGGSCIALVGPSGCGKTTILNLILRLYDPWSGNITIDGYNIKDLSFSSLKGQIGMVLQEPHLWNDTIENNIKYNKYEADFKEVQEAAKVAYIDDFIKALPQGYNTVIGENACKISEGQKQRIAISRAVINKPKILILDEALSSVDVEIETKIIGNIKSLLSNSTIVVISHRPSTIKKVGLIYYIVSSDKIDIGTHEELLRKNIQYNNCMSGSLNFISQ